MKCPICQQFLVDSSSYLLHHNIKHASQPYVFLRQCGRSYPKWAGMKKHLDKSCPRLHSNIADIAETSIPTCDPVPLVVDDNPSSSSCDTSSLVFEPHINSLDSFNYVTSLQTDADKFVASLYSKPKLPRSYVQNIVDDVSGFIQNGYLEHLKSAILPILHEDQVSAVTSVFNEFENPFSHLSSEYHRFKYFMSTGEYIAPVQYEIGEIDVSVPTANGPKLEKKMCYGTSVPLDRVLK